MLRQFLTLLALVTGFAAVAEPAQARGVGVENVAMVQQAGACVAVPGVIAAKLAARGFAQGADEPVCRFAPRAVQVPTIMLRIDRAHE